MKHTYTAAQASSTNLILQANTDDNNVEKIDVLGSVYLPLIVIVRIKRVAMDDSGGGGYVTDYVAIDANGAITRQANRNLSFPSDNARFLFFSELITINRP